MRLNLGIQPPLKEPACDSLLVLWYTAQNHGKGVTNKVPDSIKFTLCWLIRGIFILDRHPFWVSKQSYEAAVHFWFSHFSFNHFLEMVSLPQIPYHPSVFHLVYQLPYLYYLHFLKKFLSRYIFVLYIYAGMCVYTNFFNYCQKWLGST